MFPDDAQCGAMLSSMRRERLDEAAQHDSSNNHFRCPRLRALGRIDHCAIVVNDGAGCQARHIDMRFRENVLHLLPCGQKVVGNDPAVAAPPNRFSAHDHASLPTASFPEPGQAGGEGGCQGVVCVVPKAAHSPIGIGRRLGAARPSPQAAELGNMLVADLARLQRSGKCFQIKLRVGARPRYRPYVDNVVDAGLPQQIDKFGDRPGRMAYGVKGVRVIAPTGEAA